MNSPQCLSEQDLSNFELGNLPGERCQEVSQHLESCGQCMQRFESLEQPSDGTLEGFQREFPPEILCDDAELNGLMDAAAVLQEAAPKTRLKPTHEQIVSLLSLPQTEGELGWLGGYRVLEVLGIGGMGVVFKAEDPGLKRLVALKAILPQVAELSDSRRERFLREARATASIQHDNIVTIHQVGQDGDVAFLAMQLLQGESLSKRLARQPQLPIEEVLQVARETAQGLAAAHAKGLTHRDIKPDNLWLEELREESQESRANLAGAAAHSLTLDSRSSTLGSLRVKILDFGLARTADDYRDLTQEGVVVGTPSYLAPEQASGKGVDARSDLFSLGVVMYQVLTGSKPFTRDSLHATLLAIANETPRLPSEFRDDVPRQLSDLVMRLLAKDPAQRPASANEVVRAVHALQAKPQPEVFGTAPATRRLQPYALVAAGAIALTLLAMVVVTSRNKNGQEIAHAEGTQPSGSLPSVAAPTLPESPIEPNYALRFTRTNDFFLGDVRFDEDQPNTMECVLLAPTPPPSNNYTFLQIRGRAGHLSFARRDDRLFLRFREESGYKYKSSENAFDFSQPLHVASVYEPGSPGTYSLYVNGHLEARLAVGRPAPNENGLVWPGLIAGDDDDEGRVMIDEIRVSNVARYSSDYTPADRLKADDHTLALFHFDEGRDYIATDASPFRHEVYLLDNFKWVRGDIAGWLPVDDPPPPPGNYGLLFGSFWVGLSLPFEKGRSITLESTFQSQTTPTQPHRILTLAGEAGEIALCRTTEHKVAIETRDAAGPHFLESPASFDFTQPTHLAAVYSPGEVRVYVNGQPVLQAPLEELTPPSGQAFRGLVISQNFGNVAAVYDELRVSDTARYTERFTPQSRFEPDEHTQVLFHFDEGRYRCFFDASGNRRHGYWTGELTWLPRLD